MLGQSRGFGEGHKSTPEIMGPLLPQRFLRAHSLDPAQDHHRRRNPIKCQYRPINPALKPAFREQLDKWLKHDVIKPADSPWSLNLVAAKKKGGKIRWCIDWRWLNEVTKKDSWPMPTVQDTITQLAGATFSAVSTWPGPSIALTSIQTIERRLCSQHRLEPSSRSGWGH